MRFRFTPPINLFNSNIFGTFQIVLFADDEDRGDEYLESLEEEVEVKPDLDGLTSNIANRKRKRSKVAAKTSAKKSKTVAAKRRAAAKVKEEELEEEEVDEEEESLEDEEFKLEENDNDDDDLVRKSLKIFS